MSLLSNSRRIVFAAPLVGFAHKGYVTDQPPRIHWSFDYLYEIAKNKYGYSQQISKLFHSVFYRKRP